METKWGEKLGASQLKKKKTKSLKKMIRNKNFKKTKYTNEEVLQTFGIGVLQLLFVATPICCNFSLLQLPFSVTLVYCELI